MPDDERRVAGSLRLDGVADHLHSAAQLREGMQIPVAGMDAVDLDPILVAENGADSGAEAVEVR